MPNCVGTYKSSANPASKWYQNLISAENVVKVAYAFPSRAVYKKHRFFLVFIKLRLPY